MQTESTGIAVVSLSKLDLFFVLTTLVSLGFNLWQYFRDKYKFDPLKNALISLFNDLKDRQLRCYQRQSSLGAPLHSHADANILRVEFFDCLNEFLQSLEQLREHVVGAIHTLDPKAGEQFIFRAAEFGLNKQEREFREKNTERFVKQYEQQGQPAQPRPEDAAS